MSSGLSLALVPGYQFAAGELLTLDKLNLLATPTVNLSGTVGAAALADGSVTTAKLADGALSANTLGRGKMADGFITTTKLADANVTAAKLDPGAQASVQQFAAGALTGSTYAVTLTPAAGSYTAGMHIAFSIDVANPTGGTSVNVNGLGAKNLLAQNATLAGNQLLPGQIVEAIYDGAAFQVIGLLPAIFTSSNQTLNSSGQVLSIAHGLGATPRQVRWVLVCTTAELGYSIGDEVEVNSAGGSANIFAAGANATNVFLVQNGAGTPSVQLVNRTSPASGTGAITNANWRLKAYAQM